MECDCRTNAGDLRDLKIHIIAAALPPQMDGIGDYTALLATELAHSATVTVLTASKTPDAIRRVGIQTVFSVQEPRSVWNLAEHISTDKPDWVLLQYNPFSYGRWGLNLHLPEVIHTIKQKTKIAVMVHETFTPIFNLQSAVMNLWQRRQFQRLGDCADVLFYSTECARHLYPSRFPKSRRFHLPVGSNIPFVPISKFQARAELNISDDTFVLGLFGTSHRSRMLTRVSDAALTVRQAGKKPLVLSLGPDADAIKQALHGFPVCAEGPLPGEEISRRMAAMDLYLTPFTDGISTRRGTLICGLQHGLPIVGTSGSSTDSRLKSENGRSFLLADAHCPKQYQSHILDLLKQPERREELGRNARQLFADNFTWRRIADGLLDALEGATVCRN